MHPRSSRCTDCCVPSTGSRCSCTDCNTSFCVKRNKTNRCNKCKEYETSVYYYGEESRTKNLSSTVKNKSGTFDRITNRNMDYDSKESRICAKHIKNVTVANVDVKDVNVAKNNKDAAEIRSVDTVDSRKAVSNTTAHLSAQIMNLSYKDYKESVSVEKPRKSQKVISNPTDIFRKIKEAYDACTCRICECLIGKSIPSLNKPCDCEPCRCKDCTRYMRGLSNAAIDPRVIPLLQLDKIEKKVFQSKKCNCKPCECVQCNESSPEPCSCKPCQCVECNSMVIRRTKTIIVAPVEEGNQRANCLCAPCDCARCSHRGLNLSPNRMHEMSTGINRHPNCQCETCMNESCEPNGTNSCRCETRRGIMSKPFDSNTRDFDIHRATVSNNPLSSNSRKIKSEKSVPMNSVDIYFPSTQPSKQQCKCSVCECIVCRCKDNIMNNVKTSQTRLRCLKPLKLPGVDAKFCKCSPCECQVCSDGFRESKCKSCSCQVCDCLDCQGPLKPKNSNSKIIPVVLDTRCKRKCECKCNSFHRTMSRSNSEVKWRDEYKASDEVLHPKKGGELFSPSMLRNNPASEPELLKKSSVYTHIKHSKGQSNVFKNDASAHVISKQNLTIFRVIPDSKCDPPFCNSAVPFHSAKQQNKSDLTINKYKDEKSYNQSFNKSKEAKDLTAFYYASTSKTSSSDVQLETPDWHHSRNNVLESVITACLKDATGSSTSYKLQAPSLLSIPLATHELQNLSHSSFTFKSHQLNISSPDNKSTMGISETYNYDHIRSNPKFNVKQCECNICQCCGTCDESDFESDTNLIKAKTNEVTQTLQHDSSYKEDDDCFLDNPYVAYFSSNLSDGRSDSAIVRNRSKTSFLSRKADVKPNTFSPWKTKKGNPRAYSANTIDLLLPKKSAPYERALITLQKAKEFSLELGQLLQTYEKANLEFESVSKKLKESHETLFNSFKYDACSKIKEKNGYVNICNGRALSDNYIAQTHNFRNKIYDFPSQSKKSYINNLSMPLIVEDNKKLIHTKESISKNEIYYERFGFNNDIIGNTSIGTITSPSVISVCVNYNEMCKSCKENVDNCCPENLTIDLLQQKDGEVIINKESDNIALTENYCNIYRKLITRTAHIRKMSGNYNSPAESKTDIERMKTLDCDSLKKLIKQEMKVLVKLLCEIEKKSKSKSAFGEKTKLSNVLAVIDELKAKELKGMHSLADISTETKLTIDPVESKFGNEAMDAMEVTSIKNHPEMPLKNLLRGLTDYLPTAPEAFDKHKNHTATVKKALEDQQRTRKDLKTTSGSTQNAKSSPEIQSLSKSKSGYNEIKVGSVGVRRVSDHTVTIKWEKPKAIKDVQGYEVS